MLEAKQGSLEKSKLTYETGVEKLRVTGETVSELEALLKVKTIEVEEKKKEAEEIETVVGGEKAIVEVENAKAEKEQTEVNRISAEATSISKSAKEDLAKAVPLVEETKKELEGLDEKAFTTIKSFAKPPEAVEKVLYAVMWCLAKVDPNVTVDKKGNAVLDWKEAKKMINNPKAFKQVLLDFAGQVEEAKVPHNNMKHARTFLELDFFN